MNISLIDGEVKTDCPDITVYDGQILNHKKEIFIKMTEFDGNYNINEIARYYQGIGEPHYFNMPIKTLLNLLICAADCYHNKLYKAIIDILAKLSSLNIDKIFAKKDDEVLPSYFY